MRRRLFPPRMKQLSPRSATLAVIDVGSSKIACLIARLTPIPEGAPIRGRTHHARILGIGHQRSRGVKFGQVVDMEESENAIRQTVEAAERMARTQVGPVIVTASGGRIASQHFAAKTQIGGRAVQASDVHRVLEASATHTAHRGRVVMHSLPTGFSLDGVGGIRDPKNMIGSALGADLHVASCDEAAMRNLVLAVERGHLTVEAAAAAPYAAGLAVLEPDEAELGAIVIDMGAGSTSLAVFEAGGLVHVDAVMLGGNHVTMDIARGLDVRLSDAERLKTLHGSAIPSPSDERETIAFDHVGEPGEHPAHAPKSHLVRIISPRVEETLEFLRDRLVSAGYPARVHRRIILTGGGCLLTGAPEAARRILGSQVRVGRPLGIDGLPESAKSPAFAAAVGLFVYPQFAEREYFEPDRSEARRTGTHGYMSRVGRWLRESF